MEPALEAEGITKVYGKKVVLYNFSLRIQKGEIFGLLGPNGAGKSTLIRIISGLEEPDEGGLMILGAPAGKAGRRKIGLAPQENAIYPLLTCRENLTYFGSVYGVTGHKARVRADTLLSELGLTAKADQQAAHLSGGMKRRLNLACALMHEPEIIILDEPTTGLDPATRVQMWKAVQGIVGRTGATLILTTHYIEEAEALCNRIAFINSGQVVAQGTPDELKRKAGRELLKLTCIPGAPETIAKIAGAISGIRIVKSTEHGAIIEGPDIASRLPEISRALEKGGETVIEMSVSRPSLENVFLAMTGTKLREGGTVEPAE